MYYLASMQKAFPSVFDYSDPIEFLNRILLEKQARNPRFSLRAWAKELGLTQPTPLSQILRSMRPIPISYRIKFSKNLNLNRQEKRYFEAIVSIRFVRNNDEREFWIKQAAQIHRRATFELDEISNFEIFQDPLTMILLQMTELEGFKIEFSWIRKMLAFRATDAEISRSLELLTSGGYIVKTAEKRWVRTNQFLSSKHDVPSLWVKKYHQSNLKRAEDAIFTQGVDEREFGSYILCMKKERLAEAKKMIRNFTKDLIVTLTGEEEKGDVLYHFGVNFFAQTKCTKEIIS